MKSLEEGAGAPHFVAPTHSTVKKLLRGRGGAGLKLWLALALRANWKTGETWPSYTTLCKDHGFSRDLIADGIRELEKLGLLERRRRFGNSTRYFLLGQAKFPPSPLKSRGHSRYEERPNGLQSHVSAQSPELPTAVVGKADSSPLNCRLQSPAFPDANDHKVTNITERPSQNEKKGPPAAAVAVAQGLVDLWNYGRSNREWVKLTPPRKTKIAARLRDGFTEAQLREVIRKVKESPWHNGENPSGWRARGPEWVLNSFEKVEEWLAKGPSAPTRGENRGQSPTAPRSLALRAGSLDAKLHQRIAERDGVGVELATGKASAPTPGGGRNGETTGPGSPSGPA